MAGVMEAALHAGTNRHSVVVAQPREALGDGAHVVAVEKRTRTLPAPPFFLLIHVPAVAFLQSGGIFQQESREIGRAPREIDLPGKPMLRQAGQRA